MKIEHARLFSGLTAGGPGSGCHGPNCGRKPGLAELEEKYGAIHPPAPGPVPQLTGPMQQFLKNRGWKKSEHGWKYAKSHTQITFHDGRFEHWSDRNAKIGDGTYKNEKDLTGQLAEYIRGLSTIPQYK